MQRGATPSLPMISNTKHKKKNRNGCLVVAPIS